MAPAVLTSRTAIFKPEYTTYSSPEKKTTPLHKRYEHTRHPGCSNSSWFRPVTCAFNMPGSGRCSAARRGQNHRDVASNLESIVSGAFLSVYPCITCSDSQYPFGGAKVLPESLKPEPPLYPPDRNRTIAVSFTT